MYKVFVKEPDSRPDIMVVLLPGRGQPAVDLLNRYILFSNLSKTLLVGVEPIDEWYPAPKGADDQMEAVWGLKVSVPELDRFVAELQKEYGIERSKVALAGFSAGAVIAVQVAAYSEEAFGAVVVHNGAILEPENLPPSKHDTPFLLLHNENDDCFSWEERYVPMREALFDKEYAMETLENEEGGHYLGPEDIEEAGLWLKEVFNLPDEQKI